MPSSHRIIFVDSAPFPKLNHREIKNRAIGASEYQFYNLIGQLAKLNIDIICYNSTEDSEIINNVHYKNIQSFKTDIFFPTDKIIVQRFCWLIPYLSPENKIFVWFHDQCCNNIFQISNSQEIKVSIHSIFEKKNIHFIFNSQNSKEMYFLFFASHGYHFEENRCEVIYNILYKDDFFKEDAIIDKNKIVFGSAWCKGIHKIIDLFRWVSDKKSDLILVLLSPGYDYDYWENLRSELKNEFKERIQICGPLEKKEYCKVIESSLCVISPSFFETFGCIFSESYYLGTPVIADIHSGAVKEIIDNDYIVDYSQPEDFLEKIEELQKNRHNISIKLDDKFMLYENILLWKQFVLLS